MHINQKEISRELLLGAIAVLIIGGVLVYLSKSSNNTVQDNQQTQEAARNTNQLVTYKNDSFGVEFQHSKESKISYEVKKGHEFLNGEDIGLYDEKRAGVILKLENDELWINRNNKDHRDDVNYFDLELVENCEDYLGDNTIEKVINGLTFKYSEIQGAIQGKGYRRSACLNKNDKSWLLVNETLYDENLDKTAKLFDEIFTSFKFTNP